MPQHSPLVRSALRRLPAARIWAAIGAALVVVAMGVTTSLVGAISTDRSAVRGNSFAQAVRTDLGVHDLVVAPDGSDHFGPGVSSGSVQLDLLSESATETSLPSGETATVVFALPRGMRASELPAPSTAPGSTLSWSETEHDGAWEVRAEFLVQGDTPFRPDPLVFTVSAEFPEVVAAEQLALTATVELPEAYTSAQPAGSVAVPARWEVAAGVTELDFARGASATTGTVAFASHSGAAGETLHVAPGDALATSVRLPEGVTPGPLPAAERTEAREIVWTSRADGSETIVTRTETVLAPTAVYGPARASFPVELTHASARAGFVLTAAAELPARFVSAHPSASVEVPPGFGPPAPSRIAAGSEHSLAVNSRGTLLGWGRGLEGQVGQGERHGSDVPVAAVLPNGETFTNVSAGEQFSVGLASDGTIWAWGENASAQAGGTTPYVTEPLKLTPAGARVHFTEVSAGAHHAAALSSDGRVYTWGTYTAGAQGNGYLSGKNRIPTVMSSMSSKRVVAIDAGNDRTFMLTDTGEVWATGSNSEGLLGTGSSEGQYRRPVRIAMPVDEPIVQISSGIEWWDGHVLALTESGRLIGWGRNHDRQLGFTPDGWWSTSYPDPTELLVPEGIRFVKIDVGLAYSVGLGADGRVYTWGMNAPGTGIGAGNERPTPIAVPADRRFVDIAAGSEHAFALDADGTLFAWGRGNHGRLGTGDDTYLLTPAPVTLPDSDPATPAKRASEPEHAAPAKPTPRPQPDAGGSGTADSGAADSGTADTGTADSHAADSDAADSDTTASEAAESDATDAKPADPGTTSAGSEHTGTDSAAAAPGQTTLNPERGHARSTAAPARENAALR
ncbi:hypothetical protein [Leucobacter sp. PH1c]|uniref:RCC1 domain-containing protein n=1 Tax=Leucobacter sp. PH1c TaxID=1397278 RepID=UPI00046AA15D|nr:hypothetical protein [Leucobacter sp. PH1c]